METFFNFNLTTTQWLLALLATFISGLSKAGVKGISIIAVPLMALAFGSKSSTGIILPLLIMGDILAVRYYNRHANWKILRQLLPWVIVGVLIGVQVGDNLSEVLFKRLMATVILISITILIWWDTRKVKYVPQQLWFKVLMGLLVGFTTMVGNLAGPFAALFFLAMQFSKEKFIGTAAWLFFLVNFFKVPFHIFVWGTITAASFSLNLLLLPGILLGFLAGIRLVKHIKEQQYRRLILILTTIGTILIFFK